MDAFVDTFVGIFHIIRKNLTGDAWQLFEFFIVISTIIIVMWPFTSKQRNEAKDNFSENQERQEKESQMFQFITNLGHDVFNRNRTLFQKLPTLPPRTKKTHNDSLEFQNIEGENILESVDIRVYLHYIDQMRVIDVSQNDKIKDSIWKDNNSTGTELLLIYRGTVLRDLNATFKECDIKHMSTIYCMMCNTGRKPIKSGKNTPTCKLCIPIRILMSGILLLLWYLKFTAATYIFSCLILAIKLYVRFKKNSFILL